MMGAQLWSIAPFKSVFPNKESFAEMRSKYCLRYLPLITKDGRTISTEFISDIQQTGKIKVIECRIREITKRRQLEQQLVHLASFPELNPHIVMEIRKDGEIQYLNPATMEIFPTLKARGIRHPFLKDWSSLVNRLAATGWQDSLEREVKVAGSFYLQTFSPIPNTDMVRIYGLDRTERQRTGEKLERFNKALLTLRNISHLIAVEKNRNRLLKHICEELISMQGFHTAWIAAMDNQGNLLAANEAGIGRRFLDLKKQLKAGRLPHCVTRAFDEMKPTIINDSRWKNCVDCPLVLPKRTGSKTTLCSCLMHHGKVYGIFNATALPGVLIDDEEVSLFNEICQDIALALNNIDLGKNIGNRC